MVVAKVIEVSQSNPFLKLVPPDWECGSVVQFLPNMQEALSSISSSTKKQNQKLINKLVPPSIYNPLSPEHCLHRISHSLHIIYEVMFMWDYYYIFSLEEF